MIEELLPERMERLRCVTGVPVVLGGTTRHGPGGMRLVLARVIGTFGDSLLGLTIAPGRGLGGKVLCHRVPLRVHDYAAAMAITHDFDHLVVEVERLRSILAVPILVQGEVGGVLYGAVRDRRPFDDRTVRAATVLAGQLQRDVEKRLGHTPVSAAGVSPSALAELAAVIRETTDPQLRRRLVRIQQGLGGRPPSVESKQRLAPREVDTLRLVEVGASNLEIATQLGLGLETVKAYLRAAMRKLEVHNRTAAAHRARLRGEL
jgi:LuxR family transcriptional regulator, regulator of acetate metabolism